MRKNFSSFVLPIDGLRLLRLADDAPALTIYLETLMPVHANSNGQVEMAQAPVSEFDRYEPAGRVKFLNEPGLQAIVYFV